MRKKEQKFFFLKRKEKNLILDYTKEKDILLI